MENSPFNRSGRTARTPPPTPTPAPAPAPSPKGPNQSDEAYQVISTPELQSWMTSIEHCLNEMCSIAAESKMNSDQKLRINNLCRKVGHGTSQMVVQYQSLKLRTLKAQSSVQTLEEQLDLASKIEELKKSVEESSKPSNQTSFADMVKKSSTNFIQPISLSSVTIYPNDQMKTSEETKTLVQKIISPADMKLHVRGLRKTKNGGVIISTETKDDIEKVKKSVQSSSSGLKLDETHKRQPRITIIGVPTSMEESDVLSCLYHQNLADQLKDTKLETFLNLIKLSHKSGRKDAETCNFVIEVSPSIRRALITKERVFINWSSCPVRDFTLVTRCYKCHQYGHAAKSCREEQSTCGHCGTLGHTIKECMTTIHEPRCATCLRFKKPSNHNTGAANCPAKIMAEQRYINTVDYGTA